MTRDELKAFIDRLDREIEVKNQELETLKASRSGAQSMLNLPSSLLAWSPTPQRRTVSVMPASSSPNGSGEVPIRAAMREAIAAQDGPFENRTIFEWMRDKYPGRFIDSQQASVSSVMAKFMHQGLVRQLGSRKGTTAVLWEKVPDRW